MNGLKGTLSQGPEELRPPGASKLMPTVMISSQGITNMPPPHRQYTNSV